MRNRTQLGSVVVLACMAALVGASLLLRQSFRLTAFSDITQSLLLLSGTLIFGLRALSGKSRMRMFWGLIALGVGLWFFYQLLWTYFEVFRRTDVPDIFSGDIVLFIHIVPMIAALALRPHLPRNEYGTRLGHLDFALLFVWWVYLYVLLVMAWQYATPDVQHYTDNLNAVYLVEKLFFLAALVACWLQSSARWKTFYANLFAASFIYAASSYVANWAISRKIYYSGSLYDIPLAISMTWIALTGLRCHVDESEAAVRKSSNSFGIWVARCGMIAAFTLPLFGAWSMADLGSPLHVRSFRVILTLVVALAMGLMVLIRQRLLDRELNRLLQDSRDSFENLKQLQAQILQSEKMASIGQLVGGAAHELNNPITAMLGYSDLLLGAGLNPEQHSLATAISQSVRQTRSLVAGLLSFARQTSVAKAPVDLNILARTAVKLTQPQWQSAQIEICTDFDPHLPRVLGDSNQMLQVCLQLLNNSLRAVADHNGRKLTFTTKAAAGLCVLRLEQGEGGQDCSTLSTDRDAEDTVALATCKSIIQAHQGRISSQTSGNGLLVRIELPGISSAAERTPAEKPVNATLWPSQPSA